jgi:photosystem II stability/assembly factor-like uncharacterized protein
MRQHVMIGLGVALALALAGPSLVGQVGQVQNAPPSAAGGTLDSLHFRQLGPASTAGRVSDLAVYEASPAVYYVGTAHSGVWKTVNNGTTFEAQFQNRGLMSIGDVAVSQSNPDLVWAGTGESNNRQSTSWGDGVYKSTDGGKTWTNVGLRTSKHVNRILIDPRDNNVVFVAATGSLWGAGGERGVYKTVDGGKTWTQVLKVDDDTGANDLAMDATNNRILYASTYQRRRTECCMNGGGPGSGLWKSTDAGETWTRLKGGFPEGPLGRIAVDVYRRRGNVLYALVEGPAPAAGGRGAGGAGAPTAAEEGPGAGQRGGAQTGVSAAPTGLYRSDDGGATWRKVNNANPRPMYFSQVRIDPNDPEVVYLGGVGLYQTLDGGRTIATDVAVMTHDDVHGIWIDPANSNHVLIGNDGGVAASYDMAKTWIVVPNLPIATFYHVSYDMATPYNVCGGMQDNYDWCGPSQVRGSSGISNYEWTTVQGGDGFVVLQDPTDFRVAYTESQDGNMVRLDRVTFETMSVRPVAAAGEPALRWQWDTPLGMSPHDPKVIYAPANRVFRSADRGLSWTAVSPDLTGNGKRDDIVTMGVKNTEIAIARNDGILAWPAITTFAESPKLAGVLYAGTDDGRLAVTRDLGKTWTQVIDKVPGLPKGIYVSRIAPSRFDAGTVYVTFDGHRQNDFETYIYASTDFGQTWRSIGANLRGEIARTITEDLKNADVLYLGTETGLFLTLDRGKSWRRLSANLPTVRIDEITLHPRDNAMLLATHGRGIWVLDSMAPIQEYAAAQAATDAKLFTPPTSAMYRRPARDHNYEFWGDQTFYGENPPQAAVLQWNLKKDVGEVRLRISDSGTGNEVREISGQVLAGSNKAGMQAACWDLRVQPLPPAPAASAGQGRAGAGGARGGEGAQAGPPSPGAPGAQGAPPQASAGQAGGRGGPGGGQQASPFGAGCAGGGGAGGFGGGAGGNAGPFVLPGTYTVALVVDGKTVDTKPLKVVADPEVGLTAVERKRMFDMAMEMHELQRVATLVSGAITPLNARLGELAKEVAGQKDLPADVKTSFEALQKDVGAVAPRFAPAAGGRGGAGGGGGRGGAADSLVGRIGQAKSGLMGGIWPGEQTMKTYADVRAQAPKAMADANAAIAKAASLSGTLANYKLTLAAPAPVTIPASIAAVKK